METIRLLLSAVLIILSYSKVYSQDENQAQKYFENELKKALVKGLVNNILVANEDAGNQIINVNENNYNYESPSVVVKMNDGNIITCKPCAIEIRNNKGVLILPPGGSENIVIDPNTFLKFYSAGPEVQKYSSHVIGDLLLTSGKTLYNIALEALNLKGKLSGYNTVLDTEFIIGDNYSLSNSRVKLVSEIEFNLR